MPSISLTPAGIKSRQYLSSLRQLFFNLVPNYLDLKCGKMHSSLGEPMRCIIFISPWLLLEYISYVPEATVLWETVLIPRLTLWRCIVPVLKTIPDGTVYRLMHAGKCAPCHALLFRCAGICTSVVLTENKEAKNYLLKRWITSRIKWTLWSTATFPTGHTLGYILLLCVASTLGVERVILSH